MSEMLKAEGQNVFFDFAIASGENFSLAIEKALADAQAVVVLLSKNSNRSKWVDVELRGAFQSGKPVTLVLLDEEATSNWVWPLVSDRKAVKLESPRQISEVVHQVNRAIGYVGEPLSTPAYAVSSRWWVTLLVSIISAIVGALIIWFVK